MNAALADLPTKVPPPAVNRYANCVEASKRIRWDLDIDVLRGRRLDAAGTFLPDTLTRVAELAFLRPAEMRFLSRVQARTYANVLGFLERTLGAMALELSRDHWLGDQAALEALVRFASEELKHQALFRRLDLMASSCMPAGYAFTADIEGVARSLLGRSTWAVLALALDLELTVQAHYRATLAPGDATSDVWKDALLFHWKEGAQHAICAELEWRRVHAKRSAAERDAGVTDLADLFATLDRVLAAQARADAGYFLQHAGRAFLTVEEAAIHDLLHKAYRWQHLVIGAREARFLEVLRALTTPAQMHRIGEALRPMLEHVGA
jgi:hypothetical protein